MAFDREAARAAGYSDAEIEAFLKQQGEPAPVAAAPAAPAVSGFDREAARAAGYSDAEIEQFLMSGTESSGGTYDGPDTTLVGTAVQLAGPGAVMRGPTGVSGQAIKDTAKNLLKLPGKYLGNPINPAIDIMTGAPLAVSREIKEAAGPAISKAVSVDPRLIDPASGKQVASGQQRAYDRLYQAVKRAKPGAEAGLTEAFEQRGGNGVKDWMKDNKKLLNQNPTLKKNAELLTDIIPSVGQQAARGAGAAAKFAAKYALGPAALGLTAFDIKNAIDEGNYGDAAAQAALTGVGFIPGVGAPLAAGLSVPYYYGRQAYLNRNQRPQTSEPDVTQQIYGP